MPQAKILRHCKLGNNGSSFTTTDMLILSSPSLLLKLSDCDYRARPRGLQVCAKELRSSGRRKSVSMPSASTYLNGGITCGPFSRHCESQHVPREPQVPLTSPMQQPVIMDSPVKPTIPLTPQATSTVPLVPQTMPLVPMPPQPNRLYMYMYVGLDAFVSHQPGCLTMFLRDIY